MHTQKWTNFQLIDFVILQDYHIFYFFLRAAGHKDLAQRIVQLRYSLTDQLTQFVCHEAPDHSSSKHIIVPSVKAKNPRHEIDVGKVRAYRLRENCLNNS